MTALIESLEKKIAVLDEICEKDKEQEALLKDEGFSFEAFDKIVEEKSVLIFKLNKLDEGFDSVYAEVKEELNKNLVLYKKEIERMQSLISDITDRSTKIQAEEARNKALLEGIFKNERKKIKEQRSTVNAVNSYTQAMKFGDRK